MITFGSREGTKPAKPFVPTSALRATPLASGPESCSLQPVDVLESKPMADLPPPIPDFTLLRPIGRGAYGEVWLARSVTGV